MLPVTPLHAKTLASTRRLQSLQAPASLVIALLLASPHCSATAANQFHNLATYPSGGSPTQSVAADFNLDGKVDVVVLNGNGILSFLAGTGMGAFKAPKTIATLPSSWGGAPIAVGDFNGDGDEDIVLLRPPGNAVQVFFGHGDGTFAAPVTIQDGLSSAGALAKGDFNNDGRMDVVVANATSVSILFGSANGSFGKPHVTTTDLNAASYGFSSLIMTVADLNVDSHLDVAVTDGRSAAQALLGSASGALHLMPASTYSYYDPANAIAVADFNGDGKPDLALGFGTNLQEFESPYVCFFNGYGDGTFDTNGQCVGLASNAFYGMLVANMNGKPGLAFPNDPLTVLVNNGTGNFSQTNYATGGGTLAVGDFNGDHRQDIVTNNGAGVQLILNGGAGILQAPLALLLDPGLFPTVAAMNTADMNSDGHADLIVDSFLQIPVGGQEPHVKVFLGGPRNTFSLSSDAQLPFTDETSDTANPPAIGDFNHDGLLDFAYSAITSENPPDLTPYEQVFFGDGKGNFGGGPALSFDSNYLAAGYFNAGGQADLASLDSSGLAILVGKGDGNFASAVHYGVGTNPVFVLQRDLNGDGKRDLIVVNHDSDSISVLLGNGDGTFKPQKTYAAGTKPTMAVTGDFNRDGKVDIAVGSSKGISVLLGNGNGTFQPQKIYSATGPITGIAQGSVRQDGNECLLGVDSASSRFVLLPGHGDGTFGTPDFYPVDTVPSAILAADFDGDGATDIALLTGTHVTIYYNQGADRVVLSNPGSQQKVGMPVQFTATVYPALGELGIPAGTVTFKDNSTFLRTVRMSGGKATLVTDLPKGHHNIFAEYSGDAAFNPNHSATVTVSVQP